MYNKTQMRKNETTCCIQVTFFQVPVRQVFLFLKRQHRNFVHFLDIRIQASGTGRNH